MSAGAAFGQRRVRDVGAVQTSFNQMSRLCPNDSCNTPLLASDSDQCPLPSGTSAPRSRPPRNIYELASHASQTTSPPGTLTRTQLYTGCSHRASLSMCAHGKDEPQDEQDAWKTPHSSSPKPLEHASRRLAIRALCGAESVCLSVSQSCSTYADVAPRGPHSSDYTCDRPRASLWGLALARDELGRATSCQ